MIRMKVAVRLIRRMKRMKRMKRTKIKIRKKMDNQWIWVDV